MTTYSQINATWPTPLPLVTRHEAQRAAAALFRHFGKADTAVGRTRGIRRRAATVEVRRLWITKDRAAAQSLRCGWRRLVHDVAHKVHRWRYPERRPHAPLHEPLEAEMVAYVLGRGWLSGKLAPAAKPRLAGRELQVVRHAQVRARLATQKARLVRLARSIAKLCAKDRYYTRALAR